MGAGGRGGAEGRRSSARAGTAATSRPCSRRSVRRIARTSCSRRSTRSGSRCCCSRKPAGAAAARLRRDRPSRAARAAALGAHAPALRTSAASTAAVSRTASTRRTSSVSFMAAHGRSTRVEFVPFGVDEQAFAPSLAQPADRRRHGRGGPASRRRSLRPTRGRDADRSFRLVTTADRAARSHAAAEPRGRGRHPVRRDEASARGGARRRAAGARQQLLGCDDRAPAGDGARQAGRRHAHEGDRDAATGSPTARTAGSSSPATPTASPLRWRACFATSGTRGPSVPGAPDRRGELTWDRYVDRIEAILATHAQHGRVRAHDSA